MTPEVVRYIGGIVILGLSIVAICMTICQLIKSSPQSKNEKGQDES